MSRKEMSAAEAAWRRRRSDERWERRVEYLLVHFSPPSGLLRRSPKLGCNGGNSVGGSG